MRILYPKVNESEINPDQEVITNRLTKSLFHISLMDWQRQLKRSWFCSSDTEKIRKESSTRYKINKTEKQQKAASDLHRGPERWAAELQKKCPLSLHSFRKHADWSLVFSNLRMRSSPVLRHYFFITSVTSVRSHSFSPARLKGSTLDWFFFSGFFISLCSNNRIGL